MKPTIEQVIACCSEAATRVGMADYAEPTVAELAELAPWLTELAAVVLERLSAPIDMILHCPNCGTQHVDADNSDEVRIEAAERGFVHGSRDWEDFIEKKEWTNPPHLSHLCHSCGCIWRPADVPTNGVKAITTKGKADTTAAVNPVVRNAARWEALIDLCGHWQDGSDQTVTLITDDATRSRLIRVGKQILGTDRSTFESIIDDVIRSRQSPNEKT